MNKELTKQILSKFRNPYGRPSLAYFMPVNINGKKYWCATDAHKLVCIPENEHNILDNPPDDVITPNVAAIIPAFDKDIPLDISKLKAAYDGIEVLEYAVKTECECCESSGRFKYYSHWYDCKECDETGYTTTGETENKKDKSVVFNFNGCNVRNEMIKPVIEAIDMAECKNLKIVCNTASKVLLQADEIIFLLTCIVDDLEEMKVITIE